MVMTFEYCLFKYICIEERGGELVLLEGSLTRIVFVLHTDISRVFVHTYLMLLIGYSN